MAPADTTTMSAEYVSEAPACSTTTPVTSRPDGLVTRRVTRAPVSSVTFGYCASVGSTQTTWASDLA